MKFKVGDIVRFKTKEELEKIAVSSNKGGYVFCELSSGVCVNNDMIKEFCGKKIKITRLNGYSVYGQYEVRPNKWSGLYWHITTEMLVLLNLNKRL